MVRDDEPEVLPVPDDGIPRTTAQVSEGAEFATRRRARRLQKAKTEAARKRRRQQQAQSRKRNRR